MFGNVVLHRPLIGQRFDYGLLAETMLFYTDVVLLLDRGSLTQIASNAEDLSRLRRLHEEFGLKISYHREQCGTLSNTQNGVTTHRLSIFKATQHADGKKINSVPKDIEEVLLRKLGNGRAVRKEIKHLVRLTGTSSFDDDVSIALQRASAQDIADASFQTLLHDMLRISCPGALISPHWYFRPLLLDDEFAVDTNIDFAYLTPFFSRQPGLTGDVLSAAHVASYVLNAHVEAEYAGRYMAALVTDPISSMIMQRKFSQLARRRGIDAKQLDLFQETHLDGVGRIREAINNEGASFDEFLRVLKRGSKFKAWLQNTNPDRQLLSEYYKAATATTWIDALPVKALRWITGAGIGMLVGGNVATGAATSVATSAMDSIIFDRIVKGWRPNQFVEGPLKRFVNED